MESMKPLLLEECTRQEICESLEHLISKLYATTDQSKEVTPLELIGTLVYILMLESGFTPVLHATNLEIGEQFYGDCSFNIKRMRVYSQYPRNWIGNSKSIEMKFILKPIEEQFDITINMNLFGSGIALNLMLLNSTTSVPEHLYSYFISTAQYILNPNADATKKFNHLRQLSVDFKNKVSFPAKCAILHVDYKSHACLQYLPYELHVRIAKGLELESFVKLTQTCKHLNLLSCNFRIWKDYLLSRYNPLLDSPGRRLNDPNYIVKKYLNQEASGEVIDWREVCKELKRKTFKNNYYYH